MLTSLERHGVVMDGQTIYGDSVEEIASDLFIFGQPKLIQLEPGDDTNYKFILCYSPEFGLIVTRPNTHLYVKTIVFDLDKADINDYANFGKIYNHELNSLSSNPWTVQIAHWYFFSLIHYLIKEILNG